MNINNKNINNITVHDFSQRLNYFSKSNIFSGYLIEQNKSVNFRYNNNNINNNSLSGKSIKYIKQKKYNPLLKSSPKYLFPSMDKNLLCENLFQRKSQKLPNIPRNNKIYQNQQKNMIKNNYCYIFDKNNEKIISKKKSMFLSTTSFNFKKKDFFDKINSDKKAKAQNKNNIKNPLSKNINIKLPKFKINSEISEDKFDNSRNNKYYYYIIRPENCGYLVKNCFRHRKNWKELENLDNKNYNFKWQQNNHGINFNKLSINSNMKQMVNHFEYKSTISNKANLFLNMIEYAESQDINIFNYTPFTVLFDYNKANFFNKITKFEYLFKNINDYIVPLYEINERKYRKDKDRIYSCFFPFKEKIGTKTAVNIPETHIIKNKINSYENVNDGVNIEKNNKVKNNFWLIKAPNLNRGRCIKVLNNLSDIKRSIREFSMGIKLGYLNDQKNSLYESLESYYFSNEETKKFISNNYSSNNLDTNSLEDLNFHNLALKLKSKEISSNYRSNMIIVQKYIENPLLYFGRKFDIRIWALLTQDLKIYVFQEGHLKCCSINYNLNSDDTFCHITNYSFQKYNSNFGKYESGNEASFDDLQKNIEINYKKNINFKNEIFPKIISIIQFVFESVKYKINPLERKYSFEIFGFDFMLDIDFVPFLIEVNTNPGLEESSPLIKMLVPRMIDDALRLTLDREFDTVYDFGGNKRYSSLYESPFHVEGYSDNENLFKFVGDLYNSPNSEGNNKNSINKYFFCRNNSYKI